MKDDKIPKYDQLLVPTIDALKKLGGSASTPELVVTITDNLKLPESITNIQHPGTTRTELEYRLAWARTYLKGYGLITNSSRGIWALTQRGLETQKIDPQEIVKFMKSRSREKLAKGVEDTGFSVQELKNQGMTEEWRDVVFKVLTEMKPDAFERLCQRLLREAGFIRVDITGRSGDGGIDGIGIIRLGLLSFRVVFQCKRYQSSVSSPLIRNFRGSMTGRADKGLIITTGSFTRDAIQEANRDGAPSIDLIDGDKLIDLLKEHSLGINVSTIEDVTIDAEWFKKF